MDEKIEKYKAKIIKGKENKWTFTIFLLKEEIIKQKDKEPKKSTISKTNSGGKLGIDSHSDSSRNNFILNLFWKMY